MALLTCVECGRSVSDQAPACPGCGMPAAPNRIAMSAPSFVPVPDVALVAKHKNQNSIAIVVILTATIAIVAVIAIVSGAKKEADRAAEQASIAAAESARVNAEKAEQKAAKDAEDQRVAAVASTQARSTPMSRAERDAWIRQCVQKSKCKQWQLDAIISGAAAGQERLRADRVSFAASAQDIARDNGKDGETISAVPAGLISGLVARDDVGLAMFELMPSTTVAEAMKDSDGSRGAVLKVSGTIVEIHAEGAITEGALMTGNMDIIRFITSMATTNIYAQSWAAFTGVFLQEYDYRNVSGGQTRSLLLVGAFELPQNHTGKNLPESARR